MSRYRKIDPRIWGDEQFVPCNPFEKLSWFTLLTHPLMNPMGAGVFPEILMLRFLGFDGACWACGDAQCFHLGSGKGPFHVFSENGMIIRDGDLVVIANFLIYNCPDSPHTLVGWIEACEELPRSGAFLALRDHLRKHVPPLPEWLFAGLLDPLANQQNHGLKTLFWERVELYAPKPKGRPVKTSRKASHKATLEAPIKAPVRATVKAPSEGTVSPGAGAGAGAGAVAGAVAVPESKTKAVLPSAEAALRTAPRSRRNGHQPSHDAPTNAVWRAYTVAYKLRYKTEPVRNATINGQLAQFLKRVPADEAPMIAAAYVGNNALGYVRAGHSVGALLRDAEKLRTEWVTGARTTESKARELDHLQTQGDDWKGLLEKAEGQRAVAETES